MTSWANEAAFLSGGKQAPHALERGPGTKLLHILEKGGGAEDWLAGCWHYFFYLQSFYGFG